MRPLEPLPYNLKIFSKSCQIAVGVRQSTPFHRMIAQDSVRVSGGLRAQARVGRTQKFVLPCSYCGWHRYDSVKRVLRAPRITHVLPGDDQQRCHLPGKDRTQNIP